MPLFLKFLHLAAAIVWLGGMAFMLAALRPAAAALLDPPLRLPLLSRTLARFFVMVWISIAVLLLTGTLMMLPVGMKSAPLGWHLMLGLGTLMLLVFAHLYFAPFRRLRAAVDASNWPAAGQAAQQIARLVQFNFLLGWIAIAGVLFLV